MDAILFILDQKTRVPSVYNLTLDQTSGSHWTSAFLTTITGAQYLALSRILGSICKSSLLNLDTLEYSNDLNYGTALQNATTRTYQNTTASSSNPAAGFHVSAGNDYAYNLTWQGTSKVLFNGGNAAFTLGPNFANPTEWSVPASTTSGTLTLSNIETITIDPARSPSIWSYGFGAPSHQLYQFATIRVGEELHYVLPFDMETRGCSGWTSPKSNITYPQRWELRFENGDVLDIKSLSDTVYAGYVNVSGKFLGQEVGFGVVEMIKLIGDYPDIKMCWAACCTLHTGRE
ncbi:hypothetical protein BDP55DRAFT_693939 [Colletotrichum godetiae]|uniref:Uncharacterized protein n=1 Tax=Colletotrichum godetiae TaxID=1209918 RepID=A0AAJ0AN37_9PEZI|nr:uncharacterized protein BDP55DRAFT_693939 [Colletotrichum godetiae]KAK1675392.1 hypothetical protein BDP55DRAFT_693939 [Colletotrichum godetiae]